MDDSILDENSEECHEEDVQILSQNQKPTRYFLEAALVLLFLGLYLPSVLLQNQILKQTCIQFGYNSTICDEICQNKNETKHIEEKLQPYVAQLQMTINLIQTIIPAILSLFLGPWSDTFGRKKILISTSTGFALKLIACTFVCFYSEYIQPLSPWAYLFCFIPEVLLGGWPCLLTATLCYITDTTEESNRAYRLTVIEIIIFLGVFLGNIACNVILSLSDATTVFLIAASFATLSVIILIFFVDESINVPVDVSTCDKIKSLFSPVHLMEMIRTCFKRRPFKERRILLSLISILLLTVFTYNGNSTVGYLFEREKFNWTLKDHNVYESTNILLSVIGSIVGISFLKKLLKLSDISLACVALTCGLADCLLKAFAMYSWQMYTISSFTLFRILSSPMSRTLISSIVPHEEIGKVFSITTSFEAISSFAASPLYTFVYKSTFLTFAGAFFLITSVAYSISLILAICVRQMKKTRESLINPYSQIIN